MSHIWIGVAARGISRYFRLPEVPTFLPKNYENVGSMMCKPKAAKATKPEPFFDFSMSSNCLAGMTWTSH